MRKTWIVVTLLLLSFSVTASNLLLNGSFDAGLDGWQVLSPSPGDTARVQEIHGTLPGLSLGMTAAANSQTLVYQHVEVAGSDLFFQYRARILSTRGEAHIYLKPLDDTGRALGTLGWSVVGGPTGTTSTTDWKSIRFGANYLGYELRPIEDLNTWLNRTPGIDRSQIAAWGVYLLVTDGQHGIFDDLYLGRSRPDPLPVIERTPYNTPAPDADFHYVTNTPLPPNPSAVGTALKLSLSSPQLAGEMGQVWTIGLEVTNQGTLPLDTVIEAREPYGFGVEVRPTEQRIDLAPGESQTLEFTIRALRPHLVNLGKAWDVWFTATSSEQKGVTRLQVLATDPRPGTIYYVMTEDLEPIDAAGYGNSAWGNRNSWLDPLEFRIQLINKAEAMNQIADEFGAYWSHYIAWPAVEGARWASTQSQTGEWEQVIADLEASVRRETARGHQYSPHLHIDYDPFIPGQVLRYDPVTDGYWANHNEHGWARHIRDLGSFLEHDSRTGNLFFYVRELEALHGQGQQLGTRVGTYDIGDTAIEMRKSVEAYRQVGLWGSSDGGGNRRAGVGANYGSALYFTRPDNIELPATDLRQIGLVQFRPTPASFIDYAGQSPTLMTQRTREGVQAFTKDGQVLPGVHSIVGFTHAMFMMGSGGWTSTTGGHFSNLRIHLQQITEEFVKPGLLTYGTSHDLVAAYLDYYSPTLLAIYGPEETLDHGVTGYPIRLLGKDIPIDGYLHEVEVKLPLTTYGLAKRVEVLLDGEVIAWTEDLPTPQNSLHFTVAAPGEYSLRVYTEAFDLTPPQILHDPPKAALPGDLEISAVITSIRPLTQATLFYRPLGEEAFTPIPLGQNGHQYSSTLSATAPGFEYYLEARDHLTRARHGTPYTPHRVMVTQSPLIFSLQPPSGPQSGGTWVTISGHNIHPQARLTFGGRAATDLLWLGPHAIQARTPLHPPGEVQVSLTNPDDQTALGTYTYTNQWIGLSLPEILADPGDRIQIPLMADGLVGLEKASLEITWTDGALDLQQALLGPLAQGAALQATPLPLGGVQISLTSPTPLTGVGEILVLVADVTGEPGSQTPLQFSHARFNDGGLDLLLRDGFIGIKEVHSLFGRVAHYSNALPVPAVDLSVQGKREYLTTTNTQGEFGIAGVLQGSFTLTPSKNEQAAGVGAHDAAILLQAAAGALSLTPHQRLAGDVSGTGDLGVSAAHRILKAAVGDGTLPGWSFLPTSQTLEVQGDLDLEFLAIPMGDLSGSWGLEIPKVSKEISFPRVWAQPQREAWARVIFPWGFQSLELTLAYDPQILQILEVGGPKDSLMATNLLPGEARIALASAGPLPPGSEILLRLRVLSQPTRTQIQIQKARVDGSSLTNLPWGQVMIISDPVVTLPLDGLTVVHNSPVTLGETTLSKTQSSERGVYLPLTGLPSAQVLSALLEFSLPEEDLPEQVSIRAQALRGDPPGNLNFYMRETRLGIQVPWEGSILTALGDEVYRLTLYPLAMEENRAVMEVGDISNAHGIYLRLEDDTTLTLGDLLLTVVYTTANKEPGPGVQLQGDPLPHGVHLKWQAPGVEVLRALGRVPQSPYDPLAQLVYTGTGTQLVDDLPVGLPTGYGVTALTDKGYGPMAQLLLIPGTPPAPELIATPGGAQINLGWTASTGAQSYQIEKTGTQVFPPIHTPFSHWLDLAVAPGETYTYAVRAQNEIGLGPASQRVQAQAWGAQITPLPPTLLQADPVHQEALQLSWQDLSLDELSFLIELLQDGAWVELARVPTDTTSYLHSGLTPGMSYTYRVRAVNTAGTSSPSNTATAQTPSLPGFPKGLLWRELSPGSLEVRWDPPQGQVDQIEVQAYRGEMPVGSASLLSQTSARIYGFEQGEIYRIQVLFRNLQGVAEASLEPVMTQGPLPKEDLRWGGY